MSKRDEHGQYRESIQTAIDRDIKPLNQNEPPKRGEKTCPTCGAHIAAASYNAHVAKCNANA